MRRNAAAAGSRLIVCLMGLAALCVARAAMADQPPTVPLLEPGDAVANALSLADQRLALMSDVAAAKWRAHQPIGDPAREAVVIQAAATHAAQAGLAREPVEKLFALQIAMARQVQESLFERWQREGFDDKLPARSLAQELRPQIDRLTAQWIEALYLAAPDLAQGDAAARFADLAGTRLPAPRWSPEARAQLLGALAGVRFSMPRSLARARAAGVLRIGTPGDYAPFSLAGEGGLSGADVSLALELAQALALKPVFVRTTWKSLLADLAGDRFDIAAGGISITDARAAAAAFSLPTAHGGKTAVGRCADRARFPSLDAIDRADVRVIENPGGTNESFARATLHHAALAVHTDNRTVFDQILAGRADVMFTDDTEIALVTRREPRLCRLLPELYAPADKAFLLPREPEWTAAVNDWLRPALARGELARQLAEALAR